MLILSAVASTSPNAQIALRGMWDYLEAIFGDGDLEGFLTADVTSGGGFFLVAMWGAEVAGCVAMRPLEVGVGEVKRMYVSDAFRRKGVARALLGELERRARRAGWKQLRLETSTLQPEAMRLYEGLGYHPIAPYGIYADDPVTRCFEKNL